MLHTRQLLHRRHCDADILRLPSAMSVILSIDSIRHPLTGIGRYTLELARQLSALPEVQARFMAGTDIRSTVPDYHHAVSPDTTEMPRLKRYLLKTPIVVDLLSTVQSYKKMRRLRLHRDAIFHGPNFYLPRFDGLSVATIHDLSIYTWAECHPPERVRFMRKQMELTLQRADYLIADSESVRQEISNLFGWPLARIRSVPLAASASFRPRSPQDQRPVLAKYCLQPNNYTLFSGTIEPRKNISMLLDSYGDLPNSLKDRFPLVLVGYKGWKSTEIHDRIRRYERRGWVRYLGYVPEQDLPYLFAGARLFAYPSLYEGFGLPVMEAMASGVPVVCSNVGAMLEFASGIAICCEPSDKEGLSHALEKGLDDNVWHAEARTAGIERQSQYSWRRTGLETLEAYGEMLAMGTDTK